MRILVTGGTGYTGQFVLDKLGRRSDLELLYTYNSASQPSSLTLPGSSISIPGFKVDFASGEGLDAVFSSGAIDLVINTAALSNPANCEKDEEGSHAVNVPTNLIKKLKEQKERTGKEAFLLHISTDHVYAGTRPMWDEADPTEPINAYGRSKIAADRAVASDYAGNYLILRPSMIIGSQPPVQPVSRGLFLLWLDGQLQKGEKTNLFSNEHRTPTYINDLIRCIEKVVDLATEKGVAPRADAAKSIGVASEDRALNLGCPERVSRLEMGHAICKLRGLDAGLAVSTERQPPPAIPTPLDISMKMGRVERVLGVKMTPFEDALREILGVQ